MLVIKSKIKDHTDMNVSSDFAEGLNNKLIQLIVDAEERCKSNGRKTLRPQDL